MPILRSRRSLRQLFVFMVLLSESACAAPPAILIPRSSHYAVMDLKIPSNGKWLAITRNGPSVSAAPIAVNSKTLYPSSKTKGEVYHFIPPGVAVAMLHVAFDNSQMIDKSMTLCEAKVTPNTLFLVSNVPFLKPGPVPTSFLRDEEDKASTEKSKFDLGHILSLEPVDGVSPTNHVDLLIAAGSISDELEVTDYKLVLRRGEATQVLCDSSSNCRGNIHSPDLTWAGDLDGDKKMDFLLWQPVSSQLGSRYVLYLSTAATGSQLVGEAASFEWIGC
jgi:hypothetical protein